MKDIIITSTVDGFFRAGLRHPAKPTRHPAKRFSKEQLAALRAEPRLKVEDAEPVEAPQDNEPPVDEPAPEPAKKKPARK